MKQSWNERRFDTRGRAYYYREAEAKVAPELKTIEELLLQQSKGKIRLTREETERVTKYAENKRKQRLKNN